MVIWTQLQVWNKSFLLQCVFCNKYERHTLICGSEWTKCQSGCLAVSQYRLVQPRNMRSIKLVGWDLWISWTRAIILDYLSSYPARVSTQSCLANWNMCFCHSTAKGASAALELPNKEFHTNQNQLHMRWEDLYSFRLPRCYITGCRAIYIHSSCTKCSSNCIIASCRRDFSECAKAPGLLLVYDSYLHC